MERMKAHKNLLTRYEKQVDFIERQVHSFWKTTAMIQGVIESWVWGGMTFSYV